PLGPTAGAGMGLVPATALGVGGMMGAGLYTLLGLAAQSAGTWLPLAFAVGAVAAVFSVYSYAKLGAVFPSRGGAAEFINEGFGRTTLAGGLNVFQYIAYLIAAALYAAGFSEYVSALIGDGFPEVAKRVVAVAVVAVFTLVNLIGAKVVGKSESVIIIVELFIIAAFVVTASWHAVPDRIASDPGSVVGVVTAAAILYVTYQGFGVVTNAAGSMDQPRRDLPRAMFGALAIVTAVYLVVSTLVVMVLPLTTIKADAGHVLADAGRVIMGSAGFVIIAIAALLATASAVNATLFAASNVSANVAKNQQISEFLGHTVWRDGTVALLVSGVTVAVLVVFFPLSVVGQMASLAFLVVYAAVSIGHLHIRNKTGAKAWPLIGAIAINSVLFVMLLVNSARTSAGSVIFMVVAFAGSFVFEAGYRRHRGLT
ncbi:MAG: APC family permease, partial [Actinomycetes bacterium]